MHRCLRFRVERLLAVVTLLTANPAHASDEFLPPEEAFRLSAQAETPAGVGLSWDIAEGYYLYKDRFAFRSLTDGVKTGAIVWPPAELKQDDYFGEVSIYRDHLGLSLPVSRSAGAAESVRLEVTYQGCADAGLCYPPQRDTVALALPPVRGDAATSGRDGPRLLDMARSALQEILKAPSPVEELLPVEEAFRFSASVVAPEQLLAIWDIAPGTFLYREGLSLTLDDAPGVTLGEPALPEAVVKANTMRPDGELGDVAIYRGGLEVVLPISRSDPSRTEIALVASYQGCAELGVCYPPQRARVRLILPAMAEAGESARELPSAVSDPGPRSETDRIAAALADGNLGAIVALFFGLGILLSFTPCVFPMIPILSGIIAGQGHSITTSRAFVLSVIYVLAMAFTYTIAGVLFGLFGANLQAAFQNVWVLSTFAFVFVALALSMFGLYDLQVPASLQTRLAELTQRQQGGTMMGVAAMGVLSALIVGPCLAPPLAGALIFIGQTGDALLGGLALFALSVGMGIPLLAVGTTAGKLLPRAGAWMEAVKAVFGVLLLAVAIWLLERILPPSLAMALWGLLLVCSAVYMGALQPGDPGASGWFRLWRGIGLALLIYGTLMLVGAAAGGKDTLQPLRGLGLTGAAVADLDFTPIKTTADLDRELEAARRLGRPVMLDFYADWCVTCKELERYTFTDPAVIRELEGFVLLKADVTANDAEDRALLQGRFGLPGPPAIAFFGPEGTERPGQRIIGFKSAAAFVEHLREVAP